MLSCAFPGLASAANRPNADRTTRDPEPAVRPGALHGTVLIVDDEQLMRGLALEMIKHLGLDGIAVPDGFAAVKLFVERSAEIDAVIVDLTMPVMDGLAVMQELRRIRPDVPIILSSGYDEQESRRRLPAGAAISFLHKPYSLGDLRSALAAALSRSKD